MSAERSAAYVAPSLGATVREVWQAWKARPNGHGPSGTLVPVGSAVGLGTFCWSGDRLQKVTGPSAMRDATAAEEDDVADALAKGQLEIRERGTWSPYADRRGESNVLHQATGRPIPQEVEDAEGALDVRQSAAVIAVRADTIKTAVDQALQFLLGEMPPDDLELLAEHPQLPALLIERLASMSNYEIRCRIAERPQLPTSLMERLALDVDLDVRLAMAQREDLPAALIERMASDQAEDVRCVVARRGDLPPALAERMAGDEHEDVRRALGMRWGVSARRDDQEDAEGAPAPGM